MKRTCSDCGRQMFKKDVRREHTDWRSGETSYRCRECVDIRVAALIAETRARFGLA